MDPDIEARVQEINDRRSRIKSDAAAMAGKHIAAKLPLGGKTALLSGKGNYKVRGWIFFK